MGGWGKAHGWHVRGWQKEFSLNSDLRCCCCTQAAPQPRHPILMWMKQCPRPPRPAPPLFYYMHLP